jgi:endonuclease YncB( thermonuclease family)
MSRRLGVTTRAKIDRVVDGDTVDVHLIIPLRVRLLDCWAPEMHGEDRVAGAIAKAELEKLLPIGSVVHLDVPTQDASALGDVLTFGRVLGDVYIEGEEESVSEKMVARNLATKEKQ